MKDKEYSLSIFLITFMAMGHISYGATEINAEPRGNDLVFIMMLAVMLVVIIKMYLNLKKLKATNLELGDQNNILKYMASHDPVTHLYNRGTMVEHIQKHLLMQENKLSYLYDIAITNLKLINDTYSHDIGNEVLKVVAKRLRETFNGPLETLGMDQMTFLAIESNTSCKEDAISRACTLIEGLTEPIKVDYMEIDVLISVGIAMAPDHSLDAKQLIKKANMALVESLNRGYKTVYYYEDTLYIDVIKRIALEKQLRRALKLNEMVLYYQPKINLKTMKVDGCEALIRWHHPDGYIIYPNDFIPLAEDIGFIDDIGKWVVKESIYQVKKWQEQGHNIRVSLNVSGKEFDDEFIEHIHQNIKSQGVDPSLLEVEITETAALKDLNHSRHLVQTLHEFGIGVSLDDFGTGYSSMTYIKQLKASKLKIDKSFIEDLDNIEQRIVIESMILLGKKLDYYINIEGVETKKQLYILKDLGVDEVQGWLFSKAVLPEAFIDYVKVLDENGFNG
ncbi:putative bifunctional diguanylate cyclase/phosphodiesterase [Petrocella sp. FN5]|uniref:putative bifunctional diguanylate cyclase/phosphodiesterase n=1 Tax=Petrocella sp. FN5 TaxID=3032002 RepID=UPI0023DBDF47|nr:GGDEF domain-containing phosphodiesterase [Petrocella sp. FN5]MDF1618339.1 EAL domain-containing protein [Petrocella sp. FN5]